MTLVKLRPFRTGRALNRYGSYCSPFYSEKSDRYNYRELDFNPPVNIIEKEKEFHIHAELPGLEKKDIQLSFKDNVLIIKGEKKNSADVKDENYFINERRFGKFERAYRFSVPVNDDSIKAEFKNGVLQVSVPKTPEPEPTKITVK